MSVRQKNEVLLKLEVTMKRCLNSLKPPHNSKQQEWESQTSVARESKHGAQCLKVMIHGATFRARLLGNTQGRFFNTVTHTFPNMSCKAKKLCLRYYSWVLDHPQIQLMEQIGLIYYHKCSNELFCREECVRSARGGVSNRSIIH